MDLSDKERLIRIKTHLDGANPMFGVLSFTGTESISQLFSFDLELISKKNDIIFEQMAGQNVTVGIFTGATERFVNGIILAFAPDQISKKGTDLSTYRAIMVPTFWAHTEFYDCRIFQDKTIIDIIEKVLSDSSHGNVAIPELDYRIDVTDNFIKREFCVQYNESNFEFICRLCEEEGIIYYFKHENGHHTLVFTNIPTKHEIYPANTKGGVVKYQQSFAPGLEEDVIILLSQMKQLSTGKYTLRDFNFMMSTNEMLVTKDTQKGKATSKGEIYEYPGGYAKTAIQGQNFADLRMQARDAKIYRVQGKSNCRGFTPGHTFQLDQFTVEAMNGKDYLLTKVHHEASQNISSGTCEGVAYHNIFNCIPQEVPYRNVRTTRKPRIVSSQTAIVTGPDPEEIHTDEYGRVKVRFHWDRREVDKEDGNMSCWIRVSQSWAGGKWGAMHIPRVGQEVIVNFLDGDPDRPIITGRVYNDQKKPPYDLPADKTKSTIKSNTSKGGGKSNEIRFEDLNGQEEFYTHAAKDRKEVVENDMSTAVKSNQVIKVEKNRSITVSSGNETVAIQGGSRTVTVEHNEIHRNSTDFSHDAFGNYTLKVNGNINIEAGGIVKISGAKVILNG